MEELLLIVRIVLAGIFGVAGVAKLYDLSGSKKAVMGFGVPEVLAKPIGVLLPLAEIAIAILLIPIQTSWFGAISGALLLGAFCIGMIVQMIQGNAPDCHCFGQVHSEPVSPKSLIRNLIFALMAFFLVANGRENQGLNLFNTTNSFASESPMQLIIGIVLVGLLVAVVYFLKRISEQQMQIMRRIEILEFTANDGTKEVEREDLTSPESGLPIGAPAPEFALPDVNDKQVSLGDLLKPGKPLIAFFVSPTCNPCGALLPEIEQWQQDYKEKLNFVFVSSGKAGENLDKLAGTTLKQILLQKDREVAELFEAQWTPTAVLINANGKIGSKVAAGDKAIRELFEKIAAEDSEESLMFVNNTAANGLGNEIPEFELSDLSGNTVTTKDVVGSETLVAYWSTGCGYCTQMLEEFREWDKTKGKDEPNLLIISSGDVEKNKELEFESPIILDEKHEIAEKFGMNGTPSAVLVGKNGKIISEVAIGSRQIWTLLGKRDKLT